MKDINIQRVDHIQINVTDLEKAKAFYEKVLNLKEIPRPPSFDFAGAWFRMGGMDLHLVTRAPEPVSGRHFCIWVDDVHGTATALEAGEYKVAWDLKYKIAGIDRFFISDPSGNRIEVQGKER